MGFEVFLESFGETQKTGLPKAAIRGLFPAVDSGSEGTYWRISYDSLNQCDIDVTPLQNDSDRLTGLCVHRPCADMRLWESLYQILKMGSMVLFFPGGPPILAKGSSAAGLPQEMTDSIGDPVYLDSGEAIVRVVQQC